MLYIQITNNKQQKKNSFSVLYANVITNLENIRQYK